MTTIIASIASYVGGLISGYVLARLWKYPDGDQTKNRSEIVLMVVTLVWATSMIIDIISAQYETSPLVHGLMGAIVGFFYKPMLGIDREKK